MPNERINKHYESAGVNYQALDPFKIRAQQYAKETSINLQKHGLSELPESRGESAYVYFDPSTPDRYYASTPEGLGTKNLIADEVRSYTGKSHYDTVAIDTVAAIVNDLITVGATPLVVEAKFSAGSSAWFDDRERADDLLSGWKQGCDAAGAAWGAGETPVLRNIVSPSTIELAGSAKGVIKPKERFLHGGLLQDTDRIVLLASNGLHANGATLAQEIANFLPERYQSPLQSGITYGEALLKPSYMYAQLMEDLYDSGIPIHYSAHITGHGWRKLMRAEENFTYVIEQTPPIQEEFLFMQQTADMSDEEMYATFNMGAGFAIFTPQEYVSAIQFIAGRKHNLPAYHAGYIEKGEKQVIIKPKAIVFSADTLDVR